MTTRYLPHSSRPSVRFSELDGASIGVWGVGREILSLATQVRRRLPSARIAVVALDDPSSANVAALGGDPSVVFAADAVAALGACDIVIRSPGVSIYRAEVAELRTSGV